MKYDIIETKNYLLVVSDVIFDRGHFLVTPDRSVVRIREVINNESLLIENTPFRDKDGIQEIWFNEFRNSTIISHLPLNGSPILEDVDLLPPLQQEDDVDQLAEEWIDRNGHELSISLPKMPVEFECDVEIDEKIEPISTGNYPSPEDYYYRPKIKITEHGYNQWVGKYIFR